MRKATTPKGRPSRRHPRRRAPLHLRTGRRRPEPHRHHRLPRRRRRRPRRRRSPFDELPFTSGPADAPEPHRHHPIPRRRRRRPRRRRSPSDELPFTSGPADDSRTPPSPPNPSAKKATTPRTTSRPTHRSQSRPTATTPAMTTPTSSRRTSSSATTTSAMTSLRCRVTHPAIHCPTGPPRPAGSSAGATTRRSRAWRTACGGAAWSRSSSTCPGFRATGRSASATACPPPGTSTYRRWRPGTSGPSRCRCRSGCRTRSTRTRPDCGTRPVASGGRSWPGSSRRCRLRVRCSSTHPR